VSLCRSDACYQGGRVLTAAWRIGPTAVHQAEGLEASVMWYTEGKGDEDLHVHHFQRWNDAQLQQLDLRHALPLRCELPQTPLSYEGTLVRIRWCVRLRMFCRSGREIVVQAPFQLSSDSLVAPAAASGA
jgi:hypothetical protein